MNICGVLGDIAVLPVTICYFVCSYKMIKSHSVVKNIYIYFLIKKNLTWIADFHKPFRKLSATRRISESLKSAVRQQEEEKATPNVCECSRNESFSVRFRQDKKVGVHTCRSVVGRLATLSSVCLQTAARCNWMQRKHILLCFTECAVRESSVRGRPAGNRGPLQ